MADFPALAPLLDPGEPPCPAPVVSDAEIGAARGYVEPSRAASTRRAYYGDWSRFSRWCHERGAPALPAPPALVAVYLSALAAAGKTPPTVGRTLAGIAHAHKRAGHTAPHRRHRPGHRRGPRWHPPLSGHATPAQGARRRRVCVRPAPVHRR
jgi:hypothetical protein